MKGRRTIWGGRAAVRRALYMAAVSAMRWNPIIRTFYQRLTQGWQAFQSRHYCLYAQATCYHERDDSRSF